MQPGYCYVWVGEGIWGNSDCEGWDIDIYAPKGGEVALTLHRIDGVVCRVWQCPDGKIRAQVKLG